MFHQHCKVTDGKSCQTSFINLKIEKQKLVNMWKVVINI